jgi:hypothetical protein
MDKENPHKYYNNKNNMPINIIGPFSLIFFKDIYPYICGAKRPGAKRLGAKRLSGRKVSARNIHRGETSRIPLRRKNLLQGRQKVSIFAFKLFILSMQQKFEKALEKFSLYDFVTK